MQVALITGGSNKEAQASLSFSPAPTSEDRKLFFLFGDTGKYKNPKDPYKEIVWDKNPVIAARMRETWKTQEVPTDFTSMNLSFIRLPNEYCLIDENSKLLMQGEQNMVGLNINVAPNEEITLMKKNEPVCVFKVTTKL